VEGLNNRWAADLHNLMAGSLTMPHGMFISKQETPKEWVRNLHLADLGYGFYATQYMEIIDETE